MVATSSALARPVTPHRSADTVQKVAGNGGDATWAILAIALVALVAAAALVMKAQRYARAY